ncbi:hypothetical protein FVEN_g2601 [Fusarium venenatum]|uniref:HNH nuclease domain-containing protein n=1 Tax=Fusarium venenatum TaxID=56646 RepID=A0A2L2TN64_9HYPO|nr:uncharacterized protein FVRRES_05171 [Fusarium venenatum]KAG8359951.1 hypothetical protein FVEN_g2601 [Fusarium venenatum]KAH6992288.1 hypothetical protein EDB82DRAFT_535414 [Fusarium venenatum]CEI60735.1 unnamed protein product [Fusarium venenatum]
MSAQQPSISEMREMHELLDNFLRGDVAEAQPELIHAVKALFKAEPEYRKPTTIIPTHEVDTRHEYAIKIEEQILKHRPDFEFTEVHLVGIMVTPLHNLEPGGYLSYRQHWHDLAYKMNSLRCLVKRYLLQKPETPESYAVVATTTGPRHLTSMSKKRARSVSNKSKSTSRKTRSSKKNEDPDAAFLPPSDSENEKKLCRQRDHYRCIFMQTAEGECAHIIPQRWNDTRENVNLTEKVIHVARMFLDEDTLFNHADLFAHPDDVGTTDKCWNMLYFNRQLHWYLDHTSIGFKCLGIDPCEDDKTKAVVVIQLNWLHRSKDKPKIVTSKGDANDFDKLINGLRQFEEDGRPARVEPGQGMFAAVRVNNNVPLISGHIARIEMPIADAVKCQVMLDLAWALSVVAAMSGAADWPNLLPDHDDWDEIRQKAAVERWVEDQARRHLVSPEQTDTSDFLPHTSDLQHRMPDRPSHTSDLQPRTPDRPPYSPDRLPYTPRQPPAGRLQSPIPLGEITNRSRQDSSPEKRKLRLEVLGQRTETSSRRDDSPHKGILLASRMSKAEKDGVKYLTEGVHEFTLATGAFLKLYASPWTPVYGGWAFQYGNGHDFDIPSGMDVAVIHGPPQGILDFAGMTGTHAGCSELLATVARAKPKIHCFGHIHEAWGMHHVTWDGNEIDQDRSRQLGLKGLRPNRVTQDKETAQMTRENLIEMSKQRAVQLDLTQGDTQVVPGKQTLFVNAAIMSIRYRLVQLPWLIDIDLKRAEQLAQV